MHTVSPSGTETHNRHETLRGWTDARVLTGRIHGGNISTNNGKIHTQLPFSSYIIIAGEIQ